MSGPWERYRQDQAEGPWSKYATPAPTSAPAAVPPMKVDPSEGMPWYEKALVGAGAATSRALEGVGNLYAKTGLPGSDDFAQASAQQAEDRKLYEKHHPGGWATAGEVAADVGMSAVPLSAAYRGAQAVRAGRIGQALPQALARYVPVAADVAANAGYAAATAPEDRGGAAVLGGAGAAAGRALGRVATGVVRPTDEAAQLLQQGVRLTPGQAAGRDHWINSLEQKATSFPFAGYPIQAARTRALDDANLAVARSVVQHVDDTIKSGSTATEAMEQVRDAISRVYDDVLPRMRWPVDQVQSLATQVVESVPDQFPLVGNKQRQALSNYIGRRMADLGEQGRDFDVVPGEFLKQIDSELGSYARQLSKSTSAEEKVAAPMWYEVQQHWREHALKNAASNPQDFAALEKANTAYRSLLAVEKALKASGGEKVQPHALRKALEAAKIKDGPTADLSKAMNATLPGTVPDSGTAGRVLVNALPLALAGGGYAIGSDPLTYFGGGAAALLGTRAGARVLTGQSAVQRALVGYQKRLAEAIQGGQISRAQAEELFKQAVARLGRATATSSEGPAQ